MGGGLLLYPLAHTTRRTPPSPPALSLGGSDTHTPHTPAPLSFSCLTCLTSQLMPDAARGEDDRFRIVYTYTYTGGTKQEGARAKAPPPPPPAAARCVAFARSSWPRPGRARSARRGGSSRRRRRAAAACRRRLPPPHPQPPPSPPASARGRAGSLTIRRVIFWARGAAEVGGCARRGHSAEEWEGDGARTGGGGAEEEGGGGGARSEGGGMRGRGGAAEEGEGAGRALRRGRGAPRGGEGEAAAGGREKRAGVVEGGW